MQARCFELYFACIYDHIAVLLTRPAPSVMCRQRTNLLKQRVEWVLWEVATLVQTCSRVVLAASAL